uniref:Uncharacterized protein n=1 Tax=Parascaris equorum TaxID=6256 RepID=A0A914S6Q5_PAREQ
MGLAKNAGAVEGSADYIRSTPEYQQADPETRMQMLAEANKKMDAYNDLYALTKTLDKEQFGVSIEVDIRKDPFGNTVYKHEIRTPTTITTIERKEIAGNINALYLKIERPLYYVREVTISQMGGRPDGDLEEYDIQMSQAEFEAREKARNQALDYIMTGVVAVAGVLIPGASAIVGLTEGTIAAAGLDIAVAVGTAEAEQIVQHIKDRPSVISGDAKADGLRFKILGGGVMGYKDTKDGDSSEMAPYGLSATCTAEVWDERGVMTYIEASGIDKTAYQKRLGELHISDAVKNYLLNGASSGLSITEMSYDQLQDLRTGVSLLNEIVGNNEIAKECYGYYQDVGSDRAGNSLIERQGS